MFHSAPGFRLSTFELSLTAAHDFRFRWREGVLGIKHTFRFYQHAVLLLGERHKVPHLEFEGFENLARDDHLPALPHATDSLFGCGCLHDRYYRLPFTFAFSVGGLRR